MKLLSSLLALTVGAFAPALMSRPAISQTSASTDIVGTWQGFATRDSQRIPLTLKISGNGNDLKASFLNGPADHPDETPASSVTFDGTHLVASFNYFARKIDATLDNGTLTGTYGADKPASQPLPDKPAARVQAPTPFTVARVTRAVDSAASPDAPNIRGSWEIATKSSKGESAWEFRADPPIGKSPVIKTVIQRIDGDTGGLWGTWNGTSYVVSHFNAAGPALYSVSPQPDGTLLIKSLLGAVHGSSTDLIARRPADARKQNLPAPTDPTQQTTVKDPSIPFTFSFPDLSGKTVSNTDPRFRNKVVIVAIGGSWCPNCHDEAPFLASLYKKFQSKGLEIVNIDFEQGDPDTDQPRLRAFIEHYGITYPVLVGGTTDQLAEKIPRGVNLNCWPTSFFLGRDGRVVEVHAGFAGPGNTVGHAALERNITTLIEKLLAEPTADQNVSLNQGHAN